MFNLDGKNALVTGASGGIGEAISEALIQNGAFVTLSGTRVDVLESLCKRLGTQSCALAANLNSSEAIKNLVLKASEIMGSVDILINNAGCTRDNLALRMKDEDWQEVLDVNLTATFKLTRQCIKSMMKARWGRIISTTSVVGISGNPGQTNYSASKAAIIGMSKSLAHEVASRGITVNCVAPGFIETRMTETLSFENKNRIAGSIPMGRLGNSIDVAGAVVYLASDAASYVTGQTVHVNGGMLMV